MSAPIEQHAEAQRVAFDAIDVATGQLETIGTNLVDDIAFLKETIDKLQTNSGPITPEDQALLDAAQARTNALVARLQGFKAALEALDAATERVAVPPPAE